VSTSVELLGPRDAWASPAVRPLDDAVWQAWVAKGRAQDRRSSAARIEAVKWAAIAGLVAAAGLWSHLGPFAVVVRFLVTASALVVMFQSFQASHYAVAAVFGALRCFTIRWRRRSVFQATGNAPRWRQAPSRSWRHSAGGI
jgi:uncharacterized membrane protein YoaK (UPF0700 family)